jgi:hypothetical protein
LIPLPLLLALLQAPPPQVGDTIWLVRTILAPVGREVRIVAWNPEGAIETLGPGMMVRRGDSLDVRYPAVGWLPGAHTVDVPGPVLVSPDGTTDSLPAMPVTVTVASILPALPHDSLPPPQPEAAPVLRPIETAAPILALLLLCTLVLVPIHLWWRRRGKPVEAALPATPARPPELPLTRWAEAGEPRAVLAAAAAGLRSLDAGRATPESAALLARLDDALFGPGDATHGLADAAAALELAARLRGGGPG